MRIVVSINHPAHVHFFKNFVWEMERRGHEILTAASHKDVTTQLLQLYGLEYVDLGTSGSSLFTKMMSVPVMDVKMYRAVKKFCPDIFVGLASTRAAHVSRLLGVPAVIFDDTEHSRWEHRLYVPFSDAILTPNCFHKDLGEKQRRYNGYMKMVALDPDIWFPWVEKMGLDKLSETKNLN